MSNSVGRVRWTAKKLARHATIGVASGLAMPNRNRTEAPSLRALTYHRFGQSPRDPVCVRPEAFGRQLDVICGGWEALDEAQLLAILSGTRQPAPRSVVVTIDDGDASVIEHAVPALTAHRVPGIAFVLAGRVRERRGAHLSWRDLDTLVRSGISVGSHAVSHRSLMSLPEREARYEIEASKKGIEDSLGSPVRGFAYPFGTRRDYDGRLCGIVRDAGYEYAFASWTGTITTAGPRFALPRTKVESGEGTATFRAILRGRLDGWRFVDDHFPALQTSGRT